MTVYVVNAKPDSQEKNVKNQNRKCKEKNGVVKKVLGLF